jgi:hypothetical protein
LDAAIQKSSLPFLSINIQISDKTKLPSILTPPITPPITTPITPPISPKEHQSNNYNKTEEDYKEWDVISSNDVDKNKLLTINQNESQLESSLPNSTKQLMPIFDKNQMFTNKSVNNSNTNKSSISNWSNSAGNKMISLFEKVRSGFTRSNSLNLEKHSTPSPTLSLQQQPPPPPKLTLSSPPTTPSTVKKSNLFNFNSKSDIHSSLFNELNETRSTSPTVILMKEKAPLGESEFKNFLDSDGRVVQLHELKQRVFEGGCEVNKRKEIWPIILEIYPIDETTGRSMSRQQRTDFIKIKTVEYENLKAQLWLNIAIKDEMNETSKGQRKRSAPSTVSFRRASQNDTFLSFSRIQYFINFDTENKTKVKSMSTVSEPTTIETQPENTSTNDNKEQKNILNLKKLAQKIYKDVLRTDRNTSFYSGDNNRNVVRLFNILMTFSTQRYEELKQKRRQNNSNNDSDTEIDIDIDYENTTYSQGMSDLLSPLLFVLKDEGLAYTCFVQIMKRCSFNFDAQSTSIVAVMQLLGALVARYIPDFWQYLEEVGGEQLLFVYRWLLIECKREFPFNDSLKLLEVMWSTITNGQTTNDLSLNRPFNNNSSSNSNSSSINDVFSNDDDNLSLHINNEMLESSITTSCSTSTNSHYRQIAKQKWQLKNERDESMLISKLNNLCSKCQEDYIKKETQSDQISLQSLSPQLPLKEQSTKDTDGDVDDEIIGDYNSDFSISKNRRLICKRRPRFRNDTLTNNTNSEQQSQQLLSTNHQNNESILPKSRSLSSSSTSSSSSSLSTNDKRKKKGN